MEFLKTPEDKEIHKTLIEDLNKSNAVERTHDYATNLIINAKKSLENLENNRSRDSLELLAQFIIERIA